MGNPIPFRRRLGLINGSLVALAAVAALTWTGTAAAQSAAQRAVDAAKKICAGKTITIVWEAGLQSLDPKQLLRARSGSSSPAAR